MSFTKSKHIAKSTLSEESSLKTLSVFENDDDDPLSIKSLSLTFLGIIIAFLAILLPSVSVLLERPLSKSNEIISNQSIKKDGS